VILKNFIGFEMPKIQSASELASLIDHTVLKPETTGKDIEVLCDEAVLYGFNTIFVPPCFVPLAKTLVKGKAIAVGTTVGFPLGNQTSHVKMLEARNGHGRGADVLDMVANVGFIRSDRRADFIREVEEVIRVSPCMNHKVIIEACLLTNEEKIKAALWVADAGADFVKTSTGFSKGGATVADVSLLYKAVGERIKIKASGGIRDLESALSLVESGASRIGTSSGIDIIKAWEGI
jgi:deoxyribose-phosphate aldolase